MDHSFEGEKAKKTLASRIVNHADNCAFAYITEEDITEEDEPGLSFRKKI